MNFVLQISSLQHLAGVKVVTCLWSQRDLFTQIAVLRDEKNVEAEVEAKVSVLELPESCKKQLLGFIKPLGQEIYNWSGYHHNINKYVYLEDLLPQQLCWTMHGTIDYAKTALSMVKYERLSVEKRYELACVNCLEDEARELIQFIPEGRRRRNYMNKVKKVYDKKHRAIILYFTCTLTDDVDQLNRFFPPSSNQGARSLIKRLFIDKVQCGTRATCEYFFKKLNRREKNQVLSHNLKQVFYCSEAPSCSLLYYLSLMNDEQQERMFDRKRFRYVLQRLLDWPMQSLFIEAAYLGWYSMYYSHRVYVLSAIIDKINYYGYNNYSQLFWKFWHLSPAGYGEYYFEDLDILSDLLETQREEFIRLMFNEAPSSYLSMFSHLIGPELMDESVISDTALIECKERAALNSSNDQEDEDKRLRSECLSILVNRVIKDRIIRRATYVYRDHPYYLRNSV